MSHKITVLPGDGIGPEIMDETLRLLEWIVERDPQLDLIWEEFPIGGASLEQYDKPLLPEVLKAAKNSSAILLGAVGDPRWDDLPVNRRPEAALLNLRKQCGLYANLRPARIYSELVESSPLKNHRAAGADLVIVRELTGGIYFSLPRGIEGTGEHRRGFNTLSYTREEVVRITEVAVEIARQRSGKITSIDKANVLESSKLWREVVTETVPDDIQLNHLYVDNAAMQLVLDPCQFDVIVTGNMFGDILSDIASQISGSIGLLPSASLRDGALGMYEPVHGSAPDIAGTGMANPLAMILSLAMAFRYSLDAVGWADKIEKAVDQVIASGKRTADLARDNEPALNTTEIGQAVRERLQQMEEI